MLRSFARTCAISGISASLLLAAGCASTSEKNEVDAATSNVGVYPAAPQVAVKPRVGVPPFSVKQVGHGEEADVDAIAADQATTLLDAWGGFSMIERAQLDTIMKEQSLPGIAPGQAPAPNAIHGVDLILIGKVTNLSVKKTHTGTNFGLGTLTGAFINTGGVDVNKSNTDITTECGVDIRLVDPSTGVIKCSNFCDYKHTDSASAMGVAILGSNASSDADVDISSDDKGKILRLALDEAIRKSLPKFNAIVVGFTPTQPTTAPAH